MNHRRASMLFYADCLSISTYFISFFNILYYHMESKKSTFLQTHVLFIFLIESIKCKWKKPIDSHILKIYRLSNAFTILLFGAYDHWFFSFYLWITSPPSFSAIYCVFIVLPISSYRMCNLIYFLIMLSLHYHIL